MNQEIREKLRECTVEWMSNHNITWYAMQQKGALKEVGCPVSYGTIRKLVTDDSYNNMSINKQSDLLEFYNISFNKIFGTIKLVNNEEEL